MNTRETLEDLPIPEKDKEKNPQEKKEILNNRRNNPWNPYYFNSYFPTRGTL